MADIKDIDALDLSCVGFDHGTLDDERLSSTTMNSLEFRGYTTGVGNYVCIFENLEELREDDLENRKTIVRSNPPGATLSHLCKSLTS